MSQRVWLRTDIQKQIFFVCVQKCKKCYSFENDGLDCAGIFYLSIKIKINYNTSLVDVYIE